MKSPSEALEIVKAYWRSVPVDVQALVAELGLGPEFANMPDHQSGKIVRVGDDDWLVVVNRSHAVVRQRFTMAHEIGHFIFHRNLLHNGVGDTLAYRAEGTDLPNPSIGPQQEWQANNFAANLLIPDRYLKAARAAGFNDVDDLAKRFQVSRAAMKIKLGLTTKTVVETDEEEDDPQLPF